MKNQPGTIKTMKNLLGTIKNHEKPTWNYEKRQNCTTPPFNRNFGIFLGWHVIIWDGSQVKAFPNPDHPPLAIFLTY